MSNEFVDPPSERLKSFFYWINERHQIYLNKTAGKLWPWTKDPILMTRKFCNVFRELDKVTIWIRKNWREPYADHKNLPFAMAVARQINLPETLEEIGFPERWNPERVLKIIRARRDRGERMYSGAYMLSGGLGGPDKPHQTVKLILDPLYKDPPLLKPGMTLEEAWNQYLPRTGFGRFMAYEVITDLRHTKHLNKAPDIMTWANPGPGARRGLCRMWNRPFSNKAEKRKGESGLTFTLSECLPLMQYLLKISPKYLGAHVPALELRDVEHSLCETDKMERTRLGQGRIDRYHFTRPEFDFEKANKT